MVRAWMLSACRSITTRVLRTIIVEFPLKPVFAKQFHRMLGAYCSIPTTEIIGRAVFIASPADSFRMLRIDYQFRF